MANIVLNAVVRNLPTPELQSERQDKNIPGIVYGAGKDQVAVFVKQIEAVKVLATAGESTVIDLTLDAGEVIPVLIHETQIDPVTDLPIHFDFLRLDMSKPVHTHIELKFVGEAPAIKAGHIVLNQIEEIEVEALPADLVNHIDVDMSSMNEIGDEIMVKQLIIPKGIKVLTDFEHVIASVVAQRHEVIEEIKPAEETGEEAKVEDGQVTANEENKTIEK
jgi:large subunit ribosomal protein L25